MARRGTAGLFGALLLLPLVVQAPAVAQARGAAFSSFGYGETDVRGGAGRAEFFFPLRPDTKAAGETLVDLDVSHSGLLGSPSTLTVLAGDVSVVSTRLDGLNVSHGRIAARVPSELFGPAGLALSVRTYLRMTDNDCEDPANPALWATVHASSSIQVSTEPVPRDLQNAPELLVGSKDTQGVSLALAAAPDTGVLQAAAVVAARVGHWQGVHGQDALVGLTTTDTADPDRPVVVVAAGSDTPGGFPVAWTGSGFAAGGQTVAGDHGLVALAQAGAPRLLVGGTSAAAVTEAAEALAAPLAGPFAVPTGLPSAPVVRDAAPWTEGAASFAQLGIDRQDVTGLGSREVRLQIDRPSGWTVKGVPALDLVVDSAAGLDDNRSSVDVALAGVSLGSRRVQRGGGPHTYSFDIPAGLIDRALDGRAVRSLDLTIRLQLEVPHQRCQPLDVGAARAAILPTSAFRLPHDEFRRRELGRFPAPLVTSKNSQVVIVLPRSPDRTTLAAGLQLCGALGRWLEPGQPAPLLRTVDQVSEVERNEHSLVLLGDADEQLLGAALDVGRSTAVVPPGQSGAVLGVVPSPFDASKSAMVVHGDPAGLLLATRTLSSRTALAEMRGSRLSIVGTTPPVTLADIDHPSPPAELAPVIGGRSFVSRNSWAFPAVVLLTGFLAALVLVAYFRWGPRRRKAIAG